MLPPAFSVPALGYLILMSGFGPGLAQLTGGFSCDSIELQAECDDNCQYCQVQALLSYFLSLNGPEWYHNDGWPADGTIQNYTAYQHCDWFGVICCSEDSKLMVANPITLNYLLTNDTDCSVPFGVAVILLSSNNLRGNLSNELLSESALRVSLDILVLNSARLAWFPNNDANIMLMIIEPLSVAGYAIGRVAVTDAKVGTHVPHAAQTIRWRAGCRSRRCRPLTCTT